MGTVNVGLIGAGRIGKLHAEHLAYRIPQANLVAVTDVFVEAAQQCAAACNIPNVSQDHIFGSEPKLRSIDWSYITTKWRNINTIRYDFDISLYAYPL